MLVFGSEPPSDRQDIECDKRMKREWHQGVLGGTSAILLLGVLGLVEVAQVSAVRREYYVAAVKEIWDYAPSGKDNMPYKSKKNK